MAKSPLRLLCEDLCRQYEKMPNLTLAKKIVETPAYKSLVDGRSVEQIRKNYINPIRGKNGHIKRHQGTDKTQYQPITNDTRNYQPYKEVAANFAKVLLIDIETSPTMAYVWGLWNQNVSINQIEQDWFCLTWAAKWLFEDKVYSGCLTKNEVLAQNDGRIIKGIWKLLNEADIVIAHNGKKFDIPKLNSRFVIHGLMPPMPYQVIDTLDHIRRQFGFSSNKLDYVNQLLNLPRKVENEGMPLWVKCLKGDTAALKTMLDYNVGDVRILEATYLRILPYIKPHPNLGLYIMDENQCRCPACGSANLKDENKLYATTVNVYEQHRCGDCGSISRKRKAVKQSEKKRNNILSSSPK